MISRSFLLAGQAIFTVEPPAAFVADHAKARPLPGGRIAPGCRPHYTYRIREASNSGGQNGGIHKYVTELLIGPQNENDFKYLAMLNDRTGSIFAGKKYEHQKETWGFKILRHVLKAVWEGREIEIVNSGWKVHHAGQCGRCGRRLTTPESIESGIGPECQKVLAWMV